MRHLRHLPDRTARWYQKDAPRDRQQESSSERYDERFDPRTGLGGLEIWVPILD